MSWEISFRPGDKVMRVGDNTPGVPVIHYPFPRPVYGKVYCVKDCFRTKDGRRNAVTLVGFRPGFDSYGDEVGWPANAFRRVEEIKLCVEAVRHLTAAEFETTTP